MGRRERPVRRDDGREYRSLSDAARDLLNEWGMPESGKLVGQIQRDIGQCLRGKARTARGHTWEELDPPMNRADLIRLIADMYDALMHVPVPFDRLGDIPERVERALMGRRY